MNPFHTNFAARAVGLALIAAPCYAVAADTVGAATAIRPFRVFTCFRAPRRCRAGPRYSWSGSRLSLPDRLFLVPNDFSPRLNGLRTFPIAIRSRRVAR